MGSIEEQFVCDVIGFRSNFLIGLGYREQFREIRENEDGIEMWMGSYVNVW